MDALSKKVEQNLGWLLVALLFGGCLLVMVPFISILLWAAVLSYSIWPLYSRLVALLRGRRTLAAALLTIGMVLVLLLPFVVVGLTLADNVQALTTAIRRWIDAGPPELPGWIARLPVVGSIAAENWQRIASDTNELVQESKRFIEPVSLWLLKAGFSLGRGVLQLALSIVVTFFLLRDGTRVVNHLMDSIGRIAGTRGGPLLIVAGNTVRGVVYGILGTALVQAVMAGFGFLIAGVPGAALLALLTFFSSVVPLVGTALIWLPAALWLFSQGSNGWGIFMLVWGFAVSNVDNVVKPWLISQGSAMPFILILFGVLGGALAFGFIGVFIGPTLLAVGYRLIQEWLSKKEVENAPLAPEGSMEKKA